MKLLAPFVLVLAALALSLHLDDTPEHADLVFVNRNEIYTLDPQRMSYVQDLRMAYALYEGLVRWDNYTFEILPALAGLPERSADGLTWTFRLDPAGRWSNDDPVTAHDFVYAWMRALLPDTAADYSNMFFVFEGGEAFFNWRSGQLRAFALDVPSDDTIDGEQALLAIERIRTIVAADPKPAGVALPAHLDPGRVEQEAEAITASLDDPPRLRQAWRSAQTIRFALHDLADPDSRRAEAEWMYRVAEEGFRDTVGIRAVDDHTLVLTLRQPTAYLLDLLCFGVFYPVHRPTVEGWQMDRALAAAVRRSGWHAVDPPPFEERRWVRIDPGSGRLEQRHEWTKPQRLVGNGPYVLVQWRYKRDARLERNPHFRDPALAGSDSIAVLAIEDTNTAVLAFETGRIDWLSDVSAEYQTDMLAQREAYLRRHALDYEAMRADGFAEDEALAALPPPRRGERRDIHKFPTFGTDFYSFNCRPTLSDGRENPFADAGVRRAFARSINKQVIVRDVTQLDEPVMTTFIPPGSIPGYESPDGLSFDPQAARQELRDAGWIDRDGDGRLENERGDPFPVVDLLWTTNTPRYKWISLELKSQWERELGVRVELRGEDTKFYKEDLKQGKFMIARGVWYGDYGDPTTFLDLCRSTDGNNDRGYASATVDDLLDDAAREPDPERRMEILEECERFLFDEEVPLMPICQLVQVYMYEPGRVKGLSKHPRLTQYLWQMEAASR